jgi:hypothetical protein
MASGRPAVKRPSRASGDARQAPEDKLMQRAERAIEASHDAIARAKEILNSSHGLGDSAKRNR